MALGFRQYDAGRDGDLEFEEVFPNFVEVYFYLQSKFQNLFFLIQMLD